MKTTRSNVNIQYMKSFRLHRITKTSSLRKDHDNSFMNNDDIPFKLEAIHSINKGVKYNDLSYITGRDLNKLRKEPSSQTDIAFQSAHLNMSDIRKKYDDIKKKSSTLQQSLFHLKEEKQKYELKQNDFNGGKNKGRDKVQNLQTVLNQRKLLLEAIQTEKQVLKSVVHRHKSDKIFYDQQKFNHEQQYSNLKKQLKIFSKEETQFGQNTNRSTKVYEKFLKQLESQKIQREDHLENINKILYTKASVLESNQIRGIQIQQIAERAMLDKNLSQKQWEKILLTHTFMNKMLRNKIDREMETFSTVQFAFKEIKTATGVNDAQILVHKYLNKEEVYGELLGKISENEQKIQILRNKTEVLFAEQKHLQSEKQLFQNTRIAQQDLHDELKQLEFFQQKSLLSELHQTKLVNWLERQLKKFEMFDKYASIPKQNKNMVTLFNLYSQKLVQSLSKAEEAKQQHLGNFGGTPESQRLLRILPRRLRKNSLGEQIFDVDEQETNITSLVEQSDILTLQRQQVIRNNEKFMKELRKKREQMKKTLIQVMQKQKKEKEKPKVEVVKKED